VVVIVGTVIKSAFIKALFNCRLRSMAIFGIVIFGHLTLRNTGI